MLRTHKLILSLALTQLWLYSSAEKSCAKFGTGRVYNGFLTTCYFDGGGPFYRQLDVTGIEDCIDRCNEDSRCQTVGYYETDLHCYLKAYTLEQRPAYPRSISDVARRLDPRSCQAVGDGGTYNGFVTKCGYDGGGTYYRQLDVTGFKDCIDKCNADPQCHSAGYYGKDLHCYLKKGTFKDFPPFARAQVDVAVRADLPSPTPTPSCACWVTEYDDGAPSDTATSTTASSTRGSTPTPVPTPLPPYVRRPGSCFSTTQVNPDRFFPHRAADNGSPNSREPCATKCYQAGYRVYALTAGVKCYCGDDYPQGPTHYGEGQCQVNSPTYIHAGTTHNVFPEQRVVRIGCFTTAELGDRLLHRTIDNSGDNDLDECARSCYFSAYPLCAITQKRQCYCMRQRPNVEAGLDPSVCDSGAVGAWKVSYVIYS